MSVRRTPRRQHGASLVEVLVTIVIITFGLLGMAGLQLRMQISELEAYQRSQALMLLDDMANRIAVNRNHASSYVTGTNVPLGTGMTCSTSDGTTAERDLRDWCQLLQGNTETTTSGGNTTKVGGMIGARGCVEQVSGDYMITVVWQGMTPISAPPNSVACGSGSYNTSTGGSCTGDLCRRAVTTVVRVGVLT